MSNTILITGTSSGIGRTTAKYFQEKGWNVVATMRSPEKEEELTKLDRVLVTRLDVEDESSIAKAIEEGIAKFGKIDVLVNNAGFGSYGVLEATPTEKIRKQFDVNVIGLMATAKAILPHFRANKSGTIVNISSMGGRITFPLGTLYHGSKFAVEGLSEALSYETASIGVKVKLIEPGVIKTEFAGRSFDFNNDESLSEYQGMVGKLLAAAASMQENGSPPEIVAEAIMQAATDGTDRLRYVVGDDAKSILENRKAADDATFMGGIRAQFGL